METNRENKPAASGAIDRRKFIAGLGMAGAAIASERLLFGANLGTAFADGGTAATVIRVTIGELRALSAPDADALYYVSDHGQEGWFYCDAADTSSADNTGTVLVSTASGARFKRLYDGTLNARWFGVANDGTDCYDALQLLASAVSNTESVTVVFPRGTYLIDRYKITGGSGANNVTDIVYTNCKGLTILGYGAVVSVKGNFYRGKDYQASGYWYSYAKSVVPFYFTNCEQFTLEGFELDGNVDQMTRDSAVVEGNGSGVCTENCRHYLFRNLDVHHFHNDGLTLGRSHTIADKHATLLQVRTSYNARQALTIGQVDKGLFLDCAFTDSGRAAGSYGVHSPGAGCDVEPNFDEPVMDVKTNGLSFFNCTFKNNSGSQFVSGVGSRVQNIYMSNVLIDVDQNTTHNYPMILAVDNGVIEDSVMRVKNKAVYPTFNQADGTRTTIRNCKIYSSYRGLVTTSGGEGGILIENCEFIGTHDAAFADYFPYIQNLNVTFRGNTVFMPKEAYSSSTNTYDISSIIKVKAAENNTFKTDLVPTAQEHFAANYAGSERVSNDKFVSGTAFRPVYNSAFNNAYPYSTGNNNLGIPAYTTATRPAGYKNLVIVDTTLNKLVWYDGTNWRDAMGTIV